MTDEIQNFAARLHALFPGSQRAHGEYNPPTIVDGKAEIKGSATTPKTPATVVDWNRHLAGEKGLGVVPLDGDMTTWGMIDIDHPKGGKLSLADVVKAYAAVDSLLLVIATKSGGAHVLLRTTEPVLAAIMRETLVRAANASGMAHDDVYPRHNSESENKAGNWITMPAFGGEAGGQLGFYTDGRKMSLGKTVEAIERSAVPPSALGAIAPAGGLPATDDAPLSLGLNMSRDEAIALLRKKATELATAAAGNRDNLFNGLVHLCGRAVEYCDVSEQEVRDIVRPAVEQCGLSAQEMMSQAKFGRILKDGRKGDPLVTRSWHDKDKQGKPQATVVNTILAVQRLGIECSRDEFRMRDLVAGELVGKGDLNNSMVREARIAISRICRFEPQPNTMRDALAHLCGQNKFDPVLDYLNGLVWDGVPRVEKMLGTYFKAEDDSHGLNRAIATLLMVGAVRRARDPAVKFDHVVVLEGRQGARKSTAVRVLSGGFFSDQNVLNERAREQIEQMQGVWWYELAELEGLHKTDVERLKAFLTRVEDRARMAYAAEAEAHLRRTVFVGTTNSDKYLRDPTGNRRFLPVKVGDIDIEALTLDRDQLFAEAAHMEAAGAPSYLSRDMEQIAMLRQQDRVIDDPWTDALARELRPVRHEQQLKVSSKKIYATLNIDLEQQTMANLKRIADLMRQMGWTTKNFSYKGKKFTGYVRPDDGSWQAEHGGDVIDASEKVLMP